MDVLFAFPIILLAIGIIAVLGPGAVSTAIAIGVVYVPIFARTLRAPALLLRETEYVAAARACGATDRAHPAAPPAAQPGAGHPGAGQPVAVDRDPGRGQPVLPRPRHPAADRLARADAGGEPQLPRRSPLARVFSGAAILLAALGFNLLGDGLQDRLDPRLRGA